MKIKITLLGMLLLLLVLVMPVAAGFDCGINISVEMVRVDSQGYAPRLKAGDQAQFDCVTAYDPNFYTVRLPDATAATNYYYSLLGQAWGVVIQPLAQAIH